MNTTAICRFPLVARPRPACTPLPDRIADLGQRAQQAHVTGDTAAATAVFNLAALLASDCGLPDLARAWCHQLTRTALGCGTDPRYALEGVVNLARLHVRAGNGPAAWSLLESLFQAVDTRTDTTIDGLVIPAAHIAPTAPSHAALRSWLWTVLLGTGAHALASAGRWDEAHRRISQYRGIGDRMLDGRQIAVIAHALASRHRAAQAILENTRPGEAWENAVTACLTLTTSHTRKVADLVDAALKSYHELEATTPGLVVFHTRLGLSLLDALPAEAPAAEHIIRHLIDDAATDGYAARDVLTHPTCSAFGEAQQINRLNSLVDACGLGGGSLSTAQLAAVNAALSTAASTLASAPPPHALRAT